MYSPDSEKHKRLTLRYSCEDDTYAFALCIKLYAKLSCLSDDVLFSQVEEAKKISIKTGFGDNIGVVYKSRNIRKHFKVNNRQSGLRILLFLFKQLRAIECLDLTIREDIKDSTFILLLNDAECFKTYYNPDEGEFGTENTLRLLSENVLAGGAPVDANDILAEKEGYAICEVFNSLDLPKNFSSLADIETVDFSPRRHIYVSQLTSKPKREIKKPSTADLAKKKEKKKNNNNNYISPYEKRQPVLSEKAKRKALLKAIKIWNSSLPSFWDKVEMRGDHDD